MEGDLMALALSSLFKDMSKQLKFPKYVLDMTPSPWSEQSYPQ